MVPELPQRVDRIVTHRVRPHGFDDLERLQRVAGDLGLACVVASVTDRDFQLLLAGGRRDVLTKVHVQVAAPKEAVVPRQGVEAVAHLQAVLVVLQRLNLVGLPCPLHALLTLVWVRLPLGLALRVLRQAPVSLGLIARDVKVDPLARRVVGDCLAEDAVFLLLRQLCQVVVPKERHTLIAAAVPVLRVLAPVEEVIQRQLQGAVLRHVACRRRCGLRELRQLKWVLDTFATLTSRACLGSGNHLEKALMPHRGKVQRAGGAARQLVGVMPLVLALSRHGALAESSAP